MGDLLYRIRLDEGRDYVERDVLAPKITMYSFNWNSVYHGVIRPCVGMPLVFETHRRGTEWFDLELFEGGCVCSARFAEGRMTVTMAITITNILEVTEKKSVPRLP